MLERGRGADGIAGDLARFAQREPCTPHGRIVRDDRLEILRQNRTAAPKTEFAAMEYLGIARDQTH